jgi:hypothetical protein
MVRWTVKEQERWVENNNNLGVSVLLLGLSYLFTKARSQSFALDGAGLAAPSDVYSTVAD